MEFTHVSTDNLKRKLTSHIIVAKQHKQRQNADNNPKVIQCIHCFSDSLLRKIIYLTGFERPAQAPKSEHSEPVFYALPLVIRLISPSELIEPRRNSLAA